MLNKVILMGNVGRSPHIFLTQEGREVANFSLATTVSWKARPRPREGGEHGEPEWQSATDWHQITVFRESMVRGVKEHVKRGDTVYVEGKLVYQHWTDKYNRPRITAHVVVSGQSGKVEHLRSSKSSSTHNPTKLETEQDVPLPNEAPACTKDMNEDATESADRQTCLPLEASTNDFPSDPFTQDKGEIIYDN